MRVRPLTTLFVLFLAGPVSLMMAQLSPGQLGKLPTQPTDPIIGILTQPNLNNWAVECPSYVQKTYVDWLAQVGVRAAVVRYDLPHDKLTALLDQLNGVLFTGGMQNTTVSSLFYSTTKFITDYALQRNAAGDKFLLWGTCQGFQVIAMNAANNQTILPCDYKGTMTSMLPLEMTPAANSSRFLSYLAQSSPLVYEDFTQHDSTANGHDCGIVPTVFAETPGLGNQFTVISTNVDTNGKPFVSTYEHNTAEIYGIQWHPEAGQFWYDMGFNKEPATIRVAQYTALFLRERLRLNNRSYTNLMDSFNDLVPQYPIYHNPMTQYTGFYCIDAPTPANQVKATQDWRGAAIFFILAFFAVLAFAIVQTRRLAKARNPDGSWDPTKPVVVPPVSARKGYAAVNQN